MKEFLAMWDNYANFKDRTSVRGYWMAVLVEFLIGLVYAVIVTFVPALTFIGIFYNVAAFIPGLALTVRRLHDTGKHWYFILFVLVPLVGGIVLIVALCQKTSNNEGVQV